MNANPYLVTQLTEHVRKLEQELFDKARQNANLMIIGILLAIICFVSGYIIGGVYG